MPVSVDEMTKAQSRPMFEPLKKHGITKDRLAQDLSKELEAKVTKVVKVKGFMLAIPGQEEEQKLPEGYEKVIHTTDETLIARELVNWETRQRARIDAQRLLGVYPAAEYKVTHELSKIIEECMDEIGQESDVKLPSQEDE